jgi:hypothetical protein
MKTTTRSHIQFAKRLVSLLDTKFSVWKIKFGIDPILDIIPGFGNVLAVGVSCYLFYIAYRVKVPTWVYARMVWNMGVDYLFGTVPFVGIFFDLLYRSNVRNFALIEKFVEPEILEGKVIA